MAEDNGLNCNIDANDISTRINHLPTNGEAESSENTLEKKCLGEEKRQGEETMGNLPFYKLFSFADSIDVWLMVLGTIGAVGNGLSMPIMTILFGNSVNAFGDTMGTKNVVHEMSKQCLYLVYLAIGAGVTSFLQVACWMVTGERQAARIRFLYLRSILRQDISYFDKETNTGEIVGRMSGDTVLIQDAMGEKVGKVIQLVSTFCGGFVIAFIKGWLLTVVLLSFIPLLILSGALMSFVVSKMASQGQTSYSQAAIIVEQTIGAIRTVASFTREQEAVIQYNKSLMSAYKSSIHEGLASGFGLGASMFTVFCSYSLAVWYGARLIIDKGYTGGTVVNVMVALLAGSFSLGEASPCISAFAEGKAAAFKMFETINRKPEIDVYDTNGRVLNDIQGNIELRDIYFYYPTRPSEQILSGLSLSIPSGSTVALVGESGSGKSTVISLIERFYDPQSGLVLIDGINLKDFQLRWIRQKIGLVSQEPVLFTSSIKDNITYGKDDATLEEIRAAVELANAARFIDKLPQGLETLVGEHGTQLSGGQKQRIAIARAILKDPRILLLDEATSALDSESEQIVQEALDRVMVNRTTVIVAHRLTTVRNADMIYVIHQGKIVEEGAHSELLNHPGGVYYWLIHLQEMKSNSEHSAIIEGKLEFKMDSSRSLTKHLSLKRSLSRTSSGHGNSDRHSLSFVIPFGSSNGQHIQEIISIEAEAPPDLLPQYPQTVAFWRLAYLNKPEISVLLLGLIFAGISGVILPVYGVLISFMIKTFYEQQSELRKDSRFWALMFLLLGSIALVAYPSRSYFFSLAGCKLIKRIRSMCFEKTVYMEIGWFDHPEHTSGAIGAKLSADAAAVRGIVGDALSLLVQNATTLIAGLAIAFQASWQLALIILVLLPLIGINGWAQMKFLKGFSADAKMMYEAASQVATDAVGSIRTLASFCAEDKVMTLYKKKCEGPTKTGVKEGLVSGLGFGVSFFLLFCVYAVSFYAGAQLVQDGKTTVTKVYRVFFVLTMSAVAISQSSSLIPNATKLRTSSASIFEILDQKSTIDPSDVSGMTLESIKGELELQHVNFKYPTRPDIEIFNDLCLTIRARKTVALVGESGCGKSTVISLLQRFYDPSSGHITLDGIEIRKFQLKWLRKQMGLVSQEPVLFNDTIRANIAYGKEGNVTEAEIVAAAELSNAHKFICSLQQGYDTLVGERGIQLSGGQKQRVAIARAIIKEPKILLLDEATSALDAESERMVQNALDQVKVDRTTIVVAHRLSTIKDADLIAVIKNGAVAEKGKHDALINIKDGIYNSLVALHMDSTFK